MSHKYFDRSILEEEFKKKRAKIVQTYAYNNRASYAGYFSSRSTANEAVIKVIHQKGNIADLAKYVTNLDKIGSDKNLFNASGAELSQEKLNQMIKDWRGKNQQDTRENARHSTHIVLSTREKPTWENARKLKKAVAQVALRHFTTEGFDSFFVIHIDKPHLHAHLVVHNRNLLTNKKLRLSKVSQIFAMKRDFADALNAAGWNYTTTMKKDFMSVRDKADTKINHQNYILRVVEKHLGHDAREWTKKQFILSYSKDKNKAKTAKFNLARVRDVSSLDESSKAELLEEIDIYIKQREKWAIKQKLKSVYTRLDPKTINAYVDSLYASRRKYEREYNSVNSESKERLQRIEQSIRDLRSSIKRKKVARRIARFAEREKTRAERERQIRDLSQYGKMGKIYLRTLYKNLDKLESHKQKGVIQQKIDELIAGNTTEEELSFFKLSLFEKNAKPYQAFFKQRARSITDRISKQSGVPKNNIDQVEKIFSIYCAHRGLDSVYAYRQFEKRVDKYASVLKSREERKLSLFKDSLDYDLSNKISRRQKEDRSVKR